ncbi:MAG: hypothetical protein JNJ50_18065 [Acidobacteria bacterium]|nr:hypothetical protein [Acidobacteriota bacterium]
MNTKFSRAILTMAFLLGTALVANAQVKEVTPKAVAYTTAPKTFVSKLKNGDQDVYDIKGKLTFTVTAANSDDTIAGTVNYTIPDDARQKIAAQTGKPLNSIPSTIKRTDVLATFEKATAPPIIHLLLSPMDVDVAGAKVAFNRVTLDINAREGNVAQYTNEEVEALFTVWARQILNGRARRGIIARLNKVINGEPE